MVWGSKLHINGKAATTRPGPGIRTAGMSTAFVALLWSGAAWSQEQADDVDQARNSGIIIVTAQKREQTLVDVPQSISVVSGDALEAQQASSFQDYLNLVPGLQLVQDTPGFGRLVIRGVNTGGVASTVATYVCRLNDANDVASVVVDQQGSTVFKTTHAYRARVVG